MKLRFTPRATQDLVDIADYIRTRSPAGARRVRGAILDSLQNLVLWPEIGRRQTVEGVRKLVTRRYPYFVYYTVDKEQLTKGVTANAGREFGRRRQPAATPPPTPETKTAP